MNKRYLLAGLLIIGVAVALINGLRVQKKNVSVPATRSENRVYFKVKGPEGAPIQIIEFSDYECGACRKAESILQELEQAHPGKIRFVFKHYPLPNHVWSGLAHRAAECANASGKFWGYHRLLYENQEIWTKAQNPADVLMQYAAALGLNVDSFYACVVNPETAGRIASEVHEGEELKIRATPTFFINGTRLVGPVELKNRGEALIQSLLTPPATTEQKKS